jgi:WhiB family transcriptional regulator, redox-sensing transcriptional regulator
MVLRLRHPPPDDWNDAKCKWPLFPLSRDYDPFFEEEDEDKQDALDFCNGNADGVVCPIRHDCLIFALTNNCKDGIWGGTNEVTRKAIRKRYPPKKHGVPREEWAWTTERDSLKGLSREQILVELDVEE